MSTKPSHYDVEALYEWQLVSVSRTLIDDSILVRHFGDIHVRSSAEVAGSLGENNK